MVKKIRFQEVRAIRRRRNEPPSAWLIEPLDAALMGAALLALLWLQWVSHAS